MLLYTTSLKVNLSIQIVTEDANTSQMLNGIRTFGFINFIKLGLNLGLPFFLNILHNYRFTCSCENNTESSHGHLAPFLPKVTACKTEIPCQDQDADTSTA